MFKLENDRQATASDTLAPWDSLSSDARIKLRQEYGYYLDTLPPTCSLETKIEQFRAWLEERGIRYAE